MVSFLLVILCHRAKRLSSSPSVLVHGYTWKPGGDLMSARRELNMVGELLDADPIVGDQATKQRFLQEVQDACIIHIGLAVLDCVFVISCFCG